MRLGIHSASAGRYVTSISTTNIAIQNGHRFRAARSIGTVPMAQPTNSVAPAGPALPNLEIIANLGAGVTPVRIEQRREGRHE